MELSNIDKINAIKTTLFSFAERSYQLGLELQIANINGNQLAAEQYQAMLDEIAVSAKVYQDELNKLETE
jgi:hypothetical protein